MNYHLISLQSAIARLVYPALLQTAIMFSNSKIRGM